MELGPAKALAEDVLNCMLPACSRAEIAGSIRREKANVKDVEIVAIVNDYEQLYELLRTKGSFIKPGVPDIIPWEPKIGAKYVRMLINGEIKLDLFIANVDNYGALLCMRTGSATDQKGNTFNGFIPKMFSRWKKASGGGRMLNCQPTTVDGLSLSVPEEIDFFNLCGVVWVEPKDRVDGKAIKLKG